LNLFLIYPDFLQEGWLMPGVTLRLLGPPQVEINHTTVDIQRHKALAILAYLAVTDMVQHRDTLATLFWPDSAQSRASLRRDLSILNKTLDEDRLIIGRDTVALNRDDFRLDVTAFRQQIALCEGHGHPTNVVCADCIAPLQAAATLYRGDFMAGFSLPDCPGFDEWQFFQAEELRQAFASGLERLAQALSDQNDPEQAIPYARRWLALDTLHETAHRQLMNLYAAAGQQSAAIRQYQVCVQTLDEELGVEPSPETTALYERIRQADLRPAPTNRITTRSAAPAPHPSGGLHNFPTHTTPFVGRTEERAGIVQRLADPACHLLTLVGPGGIGKTRLAIAVAEQLAPSFADGAYFVLLVSITSPAQLISALANALNFSFYRDVDPGEQIRHYLQEKQMLLVLDNFEHLLNSPNADQPPTGGIDLVTDILGAAPGVKIMVTSREALNLQEEWVYPVEGMRYPTGAEDAAESYSAVQLFAQNARRVSPDFSLEAERDCVYRICQIVEGVPLAIELAAAWLKALPCAEIAAEIARGLDFLTTSMRDMPARHRSLRAVFEQSWQLLPPAEQAVMRRLSVFQGGCRQPAAEEVAGASLLELAALVEKSLLRVTPDRRYRIHELLRQFAAEKLAADPAEDAATRDRHSTYYMDFLQSHEQGLKSQHQQDAMDALRAEIKNIRIAWRRAIDRADIPAIERAYDSLYDFYRISSRFQEGAAAFRMAADALQNPDKPEALLVKLTARQAVFYALVGIYGLVRELLQQTLSIARRLDLKPEIALSLDQLGNVYAIQGESFEAERLYQESLGISRQIGDRAGTATSLYNLGWIAVGEGRYREAKAHFQESLTLHRMLENQAGIAHALDSLGMAAFLLGEYAEAEPYFRDCRAIFEALADRHGIARALGGLGMVAWGVGGARLPEARQTMADSLALFRAIGYRLEVARRLGFMGSVANSQADYDTAQQYFFEALSIAQEIGFTFGVPWALNGLGVAALGQGDPAAARTHFLQALEIAIQSPHIVVVLATLVSLADMLARASSGGTTRRAFRRRSCCMWSSSTRPPGKSCATRPPIYWQESPPRTIPPRCNPPASAAPPGPFMIWLLRF
jgi:predicted ATPase/DNA-binding SARP family transcriptional activator/Tfp pilus assembly protein PilF